MKYFLTNKVEKEENYEIPQLWQESMEWSYYEKALGEIKYCMKNSSLSEKKK